MLTTLAFALLAPGTFVVDDPKGVNAVHWFIDSPLEPIAGTGGGVTGRLEFDPAAPAKTTGRIVVPVSGLKAPVDAMSGHLRGERWLDGAKYPEIVFAITSVRTGGKGPSYKGTVTGNLTVKGVTKRISAPFTALYSPGGLKERSGGRTEGDVLKFRTNFTIKRSEFGIGPLLPGSFRSVGDEIELRVALSALKPSS